MRVGCSFIRCPVKEKVIEFCWDCDESAKCEQQDKLQEAIRVGDSFVCYQKFEDNIRFIQEQV